MNIITCTCNSVCVWTQSVSRVKEHIENQDSESKVNPLCQQSFIWHDCQHFKYCLSIYSI